MLGFVSFYPRTAASSPFGETPETPESIGVKMACGTRLTLRCESREKLINDTSYPMGHGRSGSQT